MCTKRESQYHKVEIPPPQSFHNSLKNTLNEILFADDPFRRIRNESRMLKKIELGFRHVFPILEWARDYKLEYLKSDVISGITIASLAIPQGISYAQLANLPPILGLYSSFVPPLVYAVMGSSRDLAVGTVAIASLLTAAMLGKEVNAVENPKLYLHLAFTATFFAGLMQICLGLLRLGFVVEILSHAAIVGFMGGAATVVCLQQLKGLLGLTHFTHSTDIVSVLRSIFSQSHKWRWESGVLGLCFLFFLLTTKYISKKRPKLFWISAMSPLVSVIFGSLFVYFSHAQFHGVQIIGELKKGINPESITHLVFASPYVTLALKTGIITGIISLAEGIAVGRSFAMYKNYNIDGNKEMIAFGMMNILGSFSSSYLTTGPFSRSAVNYNAGCKTAVSNVVMAIAVAMTLMFLTPLFYYTPLVVLSSIIIAAMVGLIDYEAAMNLWRLDKFDLFVCLSAYFGVVFGTIEIGLILSDTMAKHVIVYFKFKSSMYSVTLKTTVEDISLRMLEERLYKKLMLDESKVELCLRYMPLIVGCEEELRICDDEDLFAYLVSFDRDNRRSLLLVEETSRADELEKLSRVGVSSIGMNYEVSEGNNDAIRCDAIDAVGCDAIDAIGCDAIDPIGCDAIDVYVEDGQGRVENDNDIRGDDCMGVTDSECMEMVLIAGETHVEEPYVENCSQVIEEWEDGLGLSKLQEFPSKKAIQEVVDRAAFDKCFRYVTVKSDRKRLVVKCCVPSCKWGFRAAVVPNTEMFCIRNYIGVHKCSRRSQSETSKSKRRGSAQFVATFLNEEYPGKVRTPLPRDIMDLLHRKFGVKVSYSTALRGKNLAISQLRGSSEDSYKMLPSYLYMLEQANPETKTKLKLDEAGKFKYLFIALGACIRGFAVMRKVIIVDATFLKNGYGGVLVFAKAQDPNRHHYPLAIGILDGENKASWTWFFEMLRTVISDSSELVFMSDRNQSLITAVANVFPQAYHGHCIWHLSQNVRQHACNTNKSVVGWRFMELARCYTMTEFESAYASFKVRYPSAYKYVEDNTIKETWARVFFPRDRYNLDTSNSVESMNSVFKEARRYALLPLLDTIIQKISEWFNQHRKDAMNGSIDAKLVPLVEIHLHNIWAIAEKTPVRELNSYELEFQITDIDDRKLHLVNLRSRSCTCKVFDYEKYPCVHGLAAYLYYHSSDPDRRCGIQIEYQELCSKYYWAEVWAKAYEQTIYPVPHISEWNIPDYVKEIQPIPPIRSNKKGRKEDKRKPSLGERRKRTQNKRRARQNFGYHWLLFGNHRDPNE